MFPDIYFSYTLRIISSGAILIGFVAGVLSVFFVSRKQSIMGDAIAHSTLAGVTIAFFIVLEKIRILLLLGALSTGVIAILLIMLLVNYTPIKSDAAIGIVLSLFFGIGIVVLSYLQRQPVTSQAGLKHYLFGNIAFLTWNDLLSIIILSVVVLSIIIIFWKEFKIINFDPGFAQTIGIPVKKYEALLLLLTVTSIVIGVELIGTVMMAGLLIGPGIAARQWSDKFGNVIVLGGLIGALAGLIGTYSSSVIAHFPPGPAIILSLSILVFLSIILSPKGLIWKKISSLLKLQKVDKNLILKQIVIQMENRGFVPDCDIREFDLNNMELDAKELQTISKLGYIKPREGSKCILTYKGMLEADKIRESLKEESR